MILAIDDHASAALVIAQLIARISELEVERDNAQLEADVLHDALLDAVDEVNRLRAGVYDE
jgi:hypothetical protein